MIDQQTKEKILAKLSGDRAVKKQVQRYINWVVFGTISRSNYQDIIEEKLKTIIKNAFRVVYPFIDLIDSANVDLIRYDSSDLSRGVFFNPEFRGIGKECRFAVNLYIPIDFSEIFTEIDYASCLSEAFLVYLKDETLVKNLMKELENLNAEIISKLTELAKLSKKLEGVRNYWDFYVLVGDSLFEYLAYCVKYKLTCPIDSSYFQPDSLSVKDKLKAINSFFV